MADLVADLVVVAIELPVADVILLTADEEEESEADEEDDTLVEEADPEAEELEELAASRTQISVVTFDTVKVSEAEQAAAIQGVAVLVMVSLAVPHWHA